jgi:PAS domain S-box-containing protein
MRRLHILQYYPIGKKLTHIFFYTLIPVFLLISGIFLVTEFFVLRNTLLDDIAGAAKTVSLNSSASILFNDRDGAHETLRSLQSIRHIDYAAILDRQGRSFAVYQKGGEYVHSRVRVLPTTAYDFHLTHADFTRPIIFDNEPIGTIHIRSTLVPLYLRLALYNVVLLLVMGLALVVAYLLFSRLQRVVTDPINKLSALMETISRDKDYSLRSEIAASKDELGYLARGFNEMLANIQVRDAELEISRQHLEDLVRQRTSELETTNRQLQGELRGRIRVEEALAESERRYRTVFENSGSASVIVEEDGTISMVNSALEKLTGYQREEVEGRMTWTDFIAPEDHRRIQEYRSLRLMGNELAPKGYECRLRNRERATKDVYLAAAAIPGTTRIVASILDLTDLKKLEVQLMQSQKMEAVGKLAGGIAHDFNNILTAIIGYASLLRMKQTTESSRGVYIDSILSSAQKAARLTQGLLAFSRKQLIAPKPIDANEVVRRAAGLVERLMGEDVEIRTNLWNSPIIVEADAGQLEQILLNFATNARDAMPEGGFFSITTSVVNLDDAFQEKHGYGKEGLYCVISATDTGQGINRQTMAHIFDPFFTTKEVGKGTGLGLSIVYGIVKQHNGYVNAYSEEGEGSTFRVYLPLLPSAAADDAVGEEQPVMGGNETILLAEDDTATRELIRKVLEEYGYSVIEAGNGEEAVTAFDRNRGKIDLVILDVIMPRKDGKATYEAMKGIQPYLKAFFISGYTADILSRKNTYDGEVGLLGKPIIPRDLLAKVREVLDSTAASR